jgi:Na+-transporting NADH:ubiquinone oxidoreductase subunit C
MDVNKNSYTFLFAILMVIVVAALLSTAAIQLKPFQDVNVVLEKKQNILSSVGVNILRDSANIIYPKYIKDELVLNSAGNIVEGSAFDLDLSVELKKEKSEQLLPLFISEFDNEKKYIIPLRGKGLWGPIWGFIALESDLNTVFGAVFDHKAETPGLGAEINQDFFQDPFQGKNIFDIDGNFKSIVVKKGGADKDDKYAVDGISGGTITSDGVTDMLSERLNMYLPYFENLKSDLRNNDSVLNIDTLAINDINLTYE